VGHPSFQETERSRGTAVSPTRSCTRIVHNYGSPFAKLVEGIAQMSFVEQARVHPETSARFGDFHPPLERQAALAEANRCLFCFDAPCAGACPTHIDVPRFIKKIASGNLAGSARTILDANILGASCARACPVDVLCEGACVLHRYNKKPIQIGLLQRFAMDSLHASGAPLPFTPAADTGFSVALIARLRCRIAATRRPRHPLRRASAARRLEHLRRRRIQTAVDRKLAGN
jgi:hypothetical protein